MKKFIYSLAVILCCGFFNSCNDDDDFDPENTDIVGTFTDSRDGKVYTTLKLGEITWMKENLGYDAGEGSWIYANDDFYLSSYGRLYTWETAKTVCPEGWELPTNSDWEELAIMISEDQGNIERDGNHYLNIAENLKATSGWVQNNGTDNYGFQAYAGGMRYADGTFDYTGSNGFWWTIDAYNQSEGWYWNMDAVDQTLYNFIDDKEYGFSIRCISRDFVDDDDDNDDSGDDDEEIECSNELGSFVDERDNRTYKTTKICQQTWMAENLAYMPEVSPSKEGSNTEPYYYVYGYEGNSVSEAMATDNYKNYGVLYNWPAALNACPSGWHLPTDEEWWTMESYIYDNGHQNTQGTALKSTTGWSDNGNGTDDYGFNALPVGMRDWDNEFYGLGFYGYYMSATSEDEDDDNDGTIGRGFRSTIETVISAHSDRLSGGAVRCVKD